MISNTVRPSTMLRRTLKTCWKNNHPLKSVIGNDVSVPNSRAMTILSKESRVTYLKENYTERMNSTKRPVSPHVTIYSFPITALTSIANRVTGLALSIGAAGLGTVELVGGSGASFALMQEIAATGAIVGGVAKFSVAFPCTYHYLGGLRHLLWDKNPDMLTTSEVANASYALIGSSTALSLGLLFV